MDWGDSSAAAETRITEADLAELKWPAKIPCRSFYANYHGHKLLYLLTIVRTMRASRKFIWLVGDSR
jgi:hypothetical protein